MAYYDYFCPDCDAEVKNCKYPMGKAPRDLPCNACGGSMEQDFSQKRTMNYTQDNPGLYGNYEPAYLTEVKSWEHKQQLLKQYGAVEASDPVKGSRDYEPVQDAGPSGDGLTWMNTPEGAITAAGEKHGIDKRARS